MAVSWVVARVTPIVLARQILRRGKVDALVAVDGDGDAGIGVGEVHPLGALRGDAERGDEDVDLAAQQVGDAVGAGTGRMVSFTPRSSASSFATSAS